MCFGERLKSARNAKGYTQEQLATMIGVAKSTLTGYEKGNREPDVFKIKKLSKALDISADYLIGTEAEQTKKEAPIKVDESFSKEEILLIKAYRAASEDDKAIINLTLRKYKEGHKLDAEFSEHIC